MPDAVNAHLPMRQLPSTESTEPTDASVISADLRARELGVGTWKLIALLWALLLCVPAHAQVIDRVLASVDGRLVTLSDVRVTMTVGLLQESTTEQALDRWVERLLVLQEVDRFAPPEPPAAAVEERTSAALAALGSIEAAGRRLGELGVNREWVRQWVRDDLRIKAYTEQRFSGALEPTGEELENYYRQHASEFVRDGVEMPAAEAQALARDRVMASRRRALMTDWLDGLRRRATIVRPSK